MFLSQIPVTPMTASLLIDTIPSEIRNNQSPKYQYLYGNNLASQIIFCPCHNKERRYEDNIYEPISPY